MLDEVKTGLFNGLRINLKHVQEKEIPEESKAILQPFIIKKAEDNFLRIFLKPNEPLWSVNMKKAIASYLNLDTEVFANEKSKIKPNEEIKRPFEEHSIYGKCTGDITMKKLEPDSDANRIMYSKKLNYWNCTDKSLYHHTNTLKPLRSTDIFEFIDFESTNVLVMDESRGDLWKGSSKTSISYKIMHSSPYSLNTIQRQTFTLQDSGEVKESIDISELTSERNLIYEFGDESSSGRHTYETDQSVLVKNYLENYELFQQNFENSTLENHNISKTEPLGKMLFILMTMDNQGLKNIESVCYERFDFDFVNFHYTLLSYIGTNATVKYMSKFLQNVPNNRNSASLLKAFATLPRNIQYPTDDILVNLEPFMNLKNVYQPTVKSAAVLSFASAVGRACSKNTISKKYKTKYVKIFNSKYLGSANSDERMTHLLGLVNMAECLDADFMNGIVTNTSESSYLRTLAITGFKTQLRMNQSRDIFEIYWPIVQNKSEPFDVRVAVFDVLLIAYPSKANLDVIVERYSKQLNDPEDKQLANYLLTSLHSLQNTNWYTNNYIGAKATEFLKNNHIPSYPKEWATGNYRLSYTDKEPDLGAYFDTRLITDPETNIINTIQLTFNHFVSSFDFGTYSLYLKVDGVENWKYALEYIRSIGASSVPELLKLLKDNKFELKGISNINSSPLVFFVDHVAVYVIYIRNDDNNEVFRTSNELEQILTTSQYISYPVTEYTNIPSILGTPIQITNYVQDFSKHNIYTQNIRYRSSWTFQTWIEAYNPLVDTNIASYKYYVNEKNLKFKRSFKSSSAAVFTWQIEDEFYSQFWDNMMGTAIKENEILKQYCQNCNPFEELSTDVYNSYTANMEPFGFNVKIMRASHKENPYTTLNEFYHGKIHQPNVDAFPYAAPILLLAHMESRKFWFNSELQRGSHIGYPITGPKTTSQTTFTLNGNNNIRNRFQMDNHMDFHAELKTTNSIDDEVLNFANLSYAFGWVPNSKDKEGNKQLALCETFNFKFISADDMRSVKICGNRESFFPGLRGDKLSLEQFEAATGEAVFITAKNIKDDKDCIPDQVFTLKEVYSASTKEKILEDKYLQKDYNKCVSDSKDLKFTAPTAECKRVSSRLTEYDNYKIYLSMTNFENDHNRTDEIKEPFFECSREGVDKLKLALLKLPWAPEDSKDAYFKYTMYYPRKTVDPNWMAYNEHDIAISIFAISTCTLSPSTIEQFSGKYIPNAKEEWLAFAECYNVSTRGLTGHTIGDKNVGFTFYSNEHVITATVKDGKAEIKINGSLQNSFNDPFDHFRVHHLDENVFHVRDEIVDIYYNTEYISIRVPSLYNNLLCGVCNQDQ